MKVIIKLCSIHGCNSPQLARTWCEAHYRRWRSHGNPLGGRRYRTNCTVPGCGNKHSAKGYCGMHYERVKRHGDPEYQGLRDLDVIAVERAVRGDAPQRRLTVAEREAAVRRLHRQGYTDGRIGEFIGLGASGVWTIRQRLGLPANRPAGEAVTP